MLPVNSGAGGVSFTAVATSPISAWRAVRTANSNGDVTPASPVTDVVVIGIVVAAVSAGGLAVLVRSGTYTDLSWNWIAGDAVVLGDNGVLTQTLPVDAQVLQPLGIAISATRLIIRIDTNTVITT